MAQLAIKGHATRGKEVIEILEMFGGWNYNRWDGKTPRTLYFINTGLIMLKTIRHNTNIDEFSVFTLEEFEKTYPYKVGDRVTYRADKLLETQVITNMRWDSNYDCVLYYLDNCNIIKVDDILYRIGSLKDNIPTIQDKSTVETMKEDKNNKSEDMSEDIFDEVCKTDFGDISYKSSEQACDTYNKIKNNKFRNDRIFQMALALAPAFAKEGLNLQQRLLSTGYDISNRTVEYKDMLHAYGKSLKLWATAFVDELSNNTK
jgi:hypothetical protein